MHVTLRPGRAWADGILTRLAGRAARPARAGRARWPRTSARRSPAPQPTPATIDDGVRDAVILEVSEEALHGFQYPERLIEPALGGPDTTERAFVNFRFRLLRLADGEDCERSSRGCATIRRPRAGSRVSLAPVGRDRRRLPGRRRRRLHRLRAPPLPHRDRRRTVRRAGALQVVAVERRARRARAASTPRPIPTA